MALSASAKDYLSRFFPGPPSPLWETDPEFMELFANFALDEVVNQGDLDDAARMMAILAALLGCQGVEEYRVLLPAALRAGITPVQVKEILYQSVAYLGIGRVRPFFSVTNQVLTEQGVPTPGTLEYRRTGSTRRYHPGYECKWATNTIVHILERKEYLGHLVNFKTEKVSYKVKGSVENPEEKQVIFENAHEPIIDPDTWERVQELRKQRKRPNRYLRSAVLRRLRQRPLPAAV